MKHTITNLLLFALILMFGSAFAQGRRLPVREVNVKTILDQWNQYYSDLPNEKIAAKGSGFKPFKRYEWFVTPRLKPNGTIPAGARWNAFLDILDKRPNVVLSTAESANWTTLGPAASTINSAGRVLDIAFDPNDPDLVWVGSASGGLWKSSNGGATWQPVDDNLPSLAVGCVVTHNTDSDIIYIGTGEGTFNIDAVLGVGVLKSTDGGATWNTTGLSWQLSQGQAVNEMVMDPTDSNVLIAATRAGVYRTLDAGANWTQTLAFSSGREDAKDLVIDPINPSNVYVALGYPWGSENNGIYKSTDNGVNWTRLTNGLPPDPDSLGYISLTISQSNPSIVYAGISGSFSFNGSALVGIYKTTNGGTSWNAVSTSPNFYNTQGWYDNIIAVDPTNPNTVYSGGVGLYKSTNGGTSWTQITYNPTYIHVDQHAFAFHPNNSSIIYAGNDGGMFKSTNSGGSWTTINEGLTVMQFYAMGADPNNAAIAFGGTQDNGTNRYTGSPLWDHVMGGDGGEVVVDYSNSNVVYAEYQNGYHRKSTNGGNSWFDINTGLSGNGPWVTPVELDPINPQVLYTIASSNLYKTSNGGNNWSLLYDAPLSLSRCIRVAPSDDQTIYVSGSGVIYRTTNGGSSWTDITSGLPSVANPSIAVHPSDPQAVYLAMSGWDASNHVFKSGDGGTTWQNITNDLPNIPCNSIVIDPDNPINLYVGTDLGVFLTMNDGSSWVEWNTGLPNVVVDELEIHTASRMIRAATHGRGMYESPLAGEASVFVDINAPLDSVGNSSAAWGDYDDDGDLDILLTGATGTTSIAKVYRNDSGVFSDISAGLEGVSSGAVAWGDYDNDNDLDILLTGLNNSATPISKIYQNNSGSFVEIGVGLEGVSLGSVAWGDYDNDGDLDILLTGASALTNATTKIYRNSGGIFTDVGAGLEGVRNGASVAWGDYDNDGDLDILSSGQNNSNSNVTKLFRNDNGVFSEQSVGLEGVSLSDLAWGDFDDDGDLDILLTGFTNASNPTSIVYQNSGGSFSDIGASLTAVNSSSVAWGDYDNDGDLDILLTGATGSNIVSKIYQNNSGTFTEYTAAGLVGVSLGTVAWGDYDNDSDLDILLTGFSDTGEVTKIYRNDGSTVNTSPNAPANLAFSKSGSSVTLSWDKATDGETAQNGLTYNLRIGTSPGGNNISSPMARTSDGHRKLPQFGNTDQNHSWTIKNLSGGTYYWSVQSMDNAFAGSAFADEQSFTIEERPQNPYAFNGYHQAVPLAWDAPNGQSPLASSLGSAKKPTTRELKSDRLSEQLQTTRTDELRSPTASSTTQVLQTYKIYRSETSGGPYNLLTVGVDRQYYRDETVTNGISYYYVITAVYDTGESEYSDEVVGTPVEGGYFIDSAWQDGVITIDGFVDPDEWAGATTVDVTKPGVVNPVELYVKNNDTHLYLAVDDPNDPSLDANDQILPHFDEDRDRDWPNSSPSGEGRFWLYESSGANSEYQGVYGWWPDNLSYDSWITAAGTNVAISTTAGHTQFEAQIDLVASPLNAATGDTIGYYIYSWIYPDNTNTVEWPSEWMNSPWTDAWLMPATFGDLKLATDPNACTVSARIDGCPLSAPQGDQITASIYVDMTSSPAPDDKLGAFTGTLTYDTNHLTFSSALLNGFLGNVVTNAGSILFNGISATGVGGDVKILDATFDVVGDCDASGTLVLSFSAMAAAGSFTDLLPTLCTESCEYTVTCGTLGDVNGDDFANSTDALIILSCDVGIDVSGFCPLDCGDVNISDSINSTDALIILSADVGISVPYPVGESGCPTAVPPCLGCQ